MKCYFKRSTNFNRGWPSWRRGEFYRGGREGAGRGMGLERGRHGECSGQRGERAGKGVLLLDIHKLHVLS